MYYRIQHITVITKIVHEFLMLQPLHLRLKHVFDYFPRIQHILREFILKRPKHSLLLLFLYFLPLILALSEQFVASLKIPITAQTF